MSTATGALASRWADLSGPVHYLEAGDRDAPPMVLVHGLGGSNANWLSVARALAQDHRVLVPDLLGFGRTPPAGRPPTVRGHQRMIARFVDEIAGGAAVMVGNSMGGLVSLLQAEAVPESVRGLVLVDPTLPLLRGAPMDREFALGFLAFLTPALGPGLMRRRRERLGAEGQVRATMELVCTDPSRVDPDVFAAHVEVARDRAAREWVDAAYLGSARTIVAAHAGGRSWRLVRNAPAVPTLLLHGDRDRLVAVEAARHAAALRPDWTFEILAGIGHVPMLEAPAQTLDAMRRWSQARH